MQQRVAGTKVEWEDVVLGRGGLWSEMGSWNCSGYSARNHSRCQGNPLEPTCALRKMATHSVV